MPRHDKREKDDMLYQTGTFDGRSTNWAIAPQPDKDLKNMYQSVA